VGPSFLRVWLQDARDAVTEFKLLTNRWGFGVHPALDR